MSLFERFKAAVKGNAVVKEYDVGQQIASAGPGMLWRVYQGVKKSTRKEAAVFILDKKSKDFEKVNKRSREALIELLKVGPTQLARLRHPRLLTIDHPLEESNDILAFTTEPISACLANVLGEHANFQGAVPTEVKDIHLSQLEIKYGLLHLAEAMSFLHSDAKMVHGNLNPDCVFLDSVGRWKLSGFEFCFSLAESQEIRVPEWSNKGMVCSQPLLNFVAPEYTTNKLLSRCSDMFSYGMLVFVAFNGGRALYDHRNNLSQYGNNMEWISRIPLQSLDGVPEDFKETLKAMLCIEPAVRPQANDLAKSSFFIEDAQVSTLMYLDSLYEKPELEKSQFFKVLPKIITAYPKRIMLSYVMPALKGEFMDKRMIPFLLPTIFLVAEGLTSQEFAIHILPLLVPVFKMEEPVQIHLILLQRMELLLQKTSAGEIREYIVPLLHSSIRSTSSKVQELCIGLLPDFAEMLDFTSLNKYMVGQLLTLLKETDSLALQVKILVSLSKLLDVLDKDVVLHQILPRLPTVESKQPAVLMSVLGVYHTVMKGKRFNVDKYYLAAHVLPHLLTLSLQTTLKTSQYDQFVRLIHDILTKIETEHRQYLEQMGKMQEQTISTVALAQDMKDSKGRGTGAAAQSSLPFGARELLSSVKPLEPVNEPGQVTSVTPSIIAGRPADSSAGMWSQPATVSQPIKPSGVGPAEIIDEDEESSFLLTSNWSQRSQPSKPQQQTSKPPLSDTAPSRVPSGKNSLTIKPRSSVPVRSVFGVTGRDNSVQANPPAVSEISPRTLPTPSQPVIQPSQPMMNPSQPMMNPSQPMMNPSQPMMNPSQPMMNQSQPMMNPSHPMMNPSQPMMNPSQPMMNPSQPMMNPSQPMMNPSQPMMNPSQPMMNQSQPMMNPSQPMTNPGQPAFQPTPVANTFVSSSQSMINPSVSFLQPTQPVPQTLQPMESQSQPKMNPSQPLFAGMSMQSNPSSTMSSRSNPSTITSGQNYQEQLSGQQWMQGQPSMFDSMLLQSTQPNSTPVQAQSLISHPVPAVTSQAVSLGQAGLPYTQPMGTVGFQGPNYRQPTNLGQKNITSLSAKDMDDLLS